MGDYQYPMLYDSEVLNLAGGQNTPNKYSAHGQNFSCVVREVPEHTAFL